MGILILVAATIASTNLYYIIGDECDTYLSGARDAHRRSIVMSPDKVNYIGDEESTKCEIEPISL